MHTDACLGYRSTGYQRREAACGILEASNYSLIRLAGPVAKGRDAKSVLTQEAQVDFCPCRVQATNIAILTSLKLGERSPLKELGVQLWAEEGSRAGRRSAAAN